MSKPLGPSRVKKIFNGTGLVLKMCKRKIMSEKDVCYQYNKV